MLGIIVAGCRDFNDYKLAKANIQREIKGQGITKTSEFKIISGGARGADRIGETFAEEFDLNLEIIPADWDKHGKSAGPIRNRQMAEHAKSLGEGMLIAFWDGKSRGTKNMIDIATRMGFVVKIIKI